ncbi:hypothetical protein BSKO_11674 [Bryopsis sp. KO-2023]|nr:hypothetical protein BSKO_11674 [Bryopsis sp. KO-2023]
MYASGISATRGGSMATRPGLQCLQSALGGQRPIGVERRPVSDAGVPSRVSSTNENRMGVVASAGLRAGASFVNPRGISRRDLSSVQARGLFGLGGKKNGAKNGTKNGTKPVSTEEKTVSRKADVAVDEVSDITEEEVRSLFSVWNNALATGDSGIVANCYAKDAVLLPTVSDVPRTDHAGIKDYFDNFLQKKPQGKILEGTIKIGNGWAQDCGIYEFTMGIDGSKVLGRYSWVYTLENGGWKISHHHSSVMPEGIIGIATAITEDEVRGLFQLWNNALATLDADTVASRYSKNAVLLPTVSDEPRTDYAGIKDYFVNFLKKKPQGKILDGEIIIGDNWAQDAGIYEFTMGADGSKVKARYSWIYVFEDGEWKISHHHSSVMPEDVLPTPITKEEVRALFSVWNNALATGDSGIVAKCYSKNPVLLPTVSDVPRTDFESIKDYFDNFLQKKPQGVILEGEIKIGTNWAQDCGIYEFTLGIDGSKVLARYSWVYVYENGAWKISHHHSSVMPEGIIGSVQPITKDEVRGLFQLWNNALATLDSDTVARRYAKNAALLPTVSDVPRTDYDSIKDYFDNFLKKKPQGVILEGEIVIGDNWAQDAGIYEFTMGVDGSKVLARYSWIYVYEDGEWKISHHHSSLMPEESLAALGKVAELRKVSA